MEIESQLQKLRNALDVCTRILDNVQTELTDVRQRAFLASVADDGLIDPDPSLSTRHASHRAAITPDVPQGYDTVLGYLAKYHPDVLDHVDYYDPTVTQRDGWKLSHQVATRALGGNWDCVYVDAPPCLRLSNIERVRAYPVELLAKRWG